MELWGMALDTVFSGPFRSAYRALGLLLASVFVASNFPSWIRQCLTISPILAMLVVISVVSIMGQLWRKYSADVSVTFFRIVFNSAFYLNKLRREFNYGQFSNNNNENVLELRQKAAGSFLRVIVYFTMVQNCFTTSIHVAWLPLHMFLAYRFLLEYFHVAYTKVYPSVNGGRSQSQTTEASDSAELPASAPHRSYKALALNLGLHTLKLLFVFGIMQYCFIEVSGSFVALTLIYFILARQSVEERLIKLVESLQLEIFEGLEQYFVSIALGCIELFLSMTFMVWSLVIKRHMLMLLALYTNIYQRGQDIVSNTFNVALVEWTQLAQLERATSAELAGYDDVCAVCLCAMKSARKTKCNHYFHGHCLRRCLNQRPSCPLCNADVDW